MASGLACHQSMGLYCETFMNNIFIRKAKKSDQPAIERLLKELIESLDSKEGIDSTVVPEKVVLFLNNTNPYFLVAEIDGDVRGFVDFTVRRTLLHSGPSALIDELVVGSGYQNKGVGKQLLNAVIAYCKQLGCCEVEVSTELTNTNARRFYKKCGFEERGIILEKNLSQAEEFR